MCMSTFQNTCIPALPCSLLWIPFLSLPTSSWHYPLASSLAYMINQQFGSHSSHHPSPTYAPHRTRSRQSHGGPELTAVQLWSSLLCISIQKGQNPQASEPPSSPDILRGAPATPQQATEGKELSILRKKRTISLAVTFLKPSIVSFVFLCS